MDIDHCNTRYMKLHNHHLNIRDHIHNKYLCLVLLYTFHGRCKYVLWFHRDLSHIRVRTKVLHTYKLYL